jgi:MarR family transcriptional regulator, organic hydroperoxide resistance regulator
VIYFEYKVLEVRIVEDGDVPETVRLLRRLFRAIHEYSKEIQARSGLSGPQLWALTILEGQPAMSAGELAARMFVHPSSVTGVVDRLVRKGAVSRKVDAGDRRGVRLSVTAAGRRILKKTPPPVQVGLTRALNALPPRRLRDLRRSLERIAVETEADRVKAPFFDLES